MQSPESESNPSFRCQTKSSADLYLRSYPAGGPTFIARPVVGGFFSILALEGLSDLY